MTKVKGNIKAKETTLLIEGKDNHSHLFTDSEGQGIYPGDTVEFKPDKTDIFPSSGIVSKLGDKIKIDCFNMLLYRWETYNVIL